MMVDLAAECREALRRVYYLANWRDLKEAIRHLLRCREEGRCIDLWLGWELYVQRAARLRKACGADYRVSEADMAASCVEAWEALRQPAEGAALRFATQHLLDCTERGCVLLRLALVDYFRGLHLINNPVHGDAPVFPEVNAETRAAEP